MALYYDGAPPPEGQGLNKPALLVLHNVYPLAKATGQPTTDPQVGARALRPSRAVGRNGPCGGGGRLAFDCCAPTPAPVAMQPLSSNLGTDPKPGPPVPDSLLLLLLLLCRRRRSWSAS